VRILMLTREYPPDVYGGAGVHVEHLARDLEPRHPESFARDLARALNTLPADPDLRKTMGVKGRQRAEALFSWAAVARRTLALYQALVESRDR
jgi:glycosyltransferase involved in cell wall biosynthesis